MTFEEWNKYLGSLNLSPLLRVTLRDLLAAWHTEREALLARITELEKPSDKETT